MLSLVVSTPRKTASIMTILEQMVETRAWKVVVEFASNTERLWNTLFLDVGC